VGADDLVIREVGVADTSADDSAAAGAGWDLGELEVGDVDEGGGVLDVVLHEVEEVGATAEELRALGGAGVGEEDGAGAALSVVANLLRSRQSMCSRRASRRVVRESSERDFDSPLTLRVRFRV